MDKKYQVFVSSTYEDLQEERKEVMQVLLEMDCIPSGMELFPAADDDMWTLIKGVIDDCDYYMVIIGGRYGSTGPDGMSFTEKEYRYAVEKEKPVMAFLHGDPNSIPQGVAEDSHEGKKKLAAFRKLAQQKSCKFWTTPHEVGSMVARSLTQLKKSSPGIGWVRGDQVLDRESAKEIIRLQKQIESLQISSAPTGAEKFAQGEDEFEIWVVVTCTATSRDHFVPLTHRDYYGYSATSTWDDLFRTISPLMINEASEQSLQDALAPLFNAQSRQALLTSEHADKEFERNHVGNDSFRTILVQFRVLGLIEKSIRNRSVNDKQTYWTLTPHGDMVMNGLRAITRPTTPETK